MYFFSIFLVFMTLKGATNGACAACKYQRRRCAVDCPLAPYFPADQPKLFQNVHRLFGVRSIVKILEKLEDHQKPEAMKSIIFESYCRERYPVHGCLGIIQNMQYMTFLAEEELKQIKGQLELYRHPHQQRNNQQRNNNIMIPENTSQQLDLGMTLMSQTNVGNVVALSSSLPISYQIYGNDCNNLYNDADWSRYSSSYNGFDENGEDIKTMQMQSQPLNLQKKEEEEEDENEQKDYDMQFLNQSFEDSRDRRYDS